jgi:hypothetical protein
MKKFVALVLGGILIAFLLISVLPAAPAAAKVGTLSLFDVRYNPNNGLVVIFEVNNGVLGPRNLHATITINGDTYDFSCVYKRDDAMVVCMSNIRLSGGEQANIHIDGQNFLVTVPKITYLTASTSLPASCPSGKVPGYIATITGTLGGSPRSETQTATEDEVASYGGTSSWGNNLVDLYTIEMEWDNVSVNIGTGCVNP